jgi:hypothetical protein
MPSGGRHVHSPVAGTSDVRLPALLDALERSGFSLGDVMRPAARADELAELVVEPLVSEVALLLRDPLLQTKMRLDDELEHRVTPRGLLDRLGGFLHEGSRRRSWRRGNNYPRQLSAIQSPPGRSPPLFPQPLKAPTSHARVVHGMLRIAMAEIILHDAQIGALCRQDSSRRSAVAYAGEPLASPHSCRQHAPSIAPTILSAVALAPTGTATEADRCV